MSGTSKTVERVIGEQYRIIKELGAGGMGTIYYGVHILTEQPVAIKMLHPNLLSDDVVRKRFLSEASVLARMEHPHIVQWKNSIEDPSGLYLIMQYIEGDNVESRLQSQDQLPLEEAIPIAIQTLSGLGYVHSKGVVHRDLKPSNILLTEDHQVKLADFGIARLRGTNRFTKAGMTIGTFFYMAPEQILGHDSDHRADLYSMGITFFEMLTGQMPFEGDTEFDVCKQHLESPMPSLRKYFHNLPKKLDEILAKATAKKPDDRFQSADEFIAALEINFPEHAQKAAAPLGGSSSLTHAEVSKLLEEYQNKPKSGGCTGFLFKLILFLALILGCWVGFFHLFDSSEDQLIKRSEVPAARPANPRPPPPRRTFAFRSIVPKRPFETKFQHNQAMWPTGSRFGADISMEGGLYSVRTHPGTGQATLCPAQLSAVTAPLRVSFSSDAKQPDKAGRAVHGVAIFFELEQNKSRGYYVAIDPPNQKFTVARLTQGKWSRLQPWTVHKALRPKQTNHVEIHVQGAGFKLTINQKSAALTSDLRYTKGRVCLFVQRGGTAIHFRYFRIAK